MSRKHSKMHERYPSHDRTVRMLEVRLETLAGASERSLSGSRALDPWVLAAEAATRHAVRLDLISPDEAGEIWAAVARRHPRVRWCQAGPSLAA